MPSTSPSRRAVLRAALVGTTSVALLGGCSGERIRTPWSPEPTVDEAEAARRLPDGDLLLRARERLAGHRATLSTVQAGPSEVRATVISLAGLWQTQQERIEQLLTLGGIPLPELDVQVRPTVDDAAVTTAVGREGGSGSDDETATTVPDGAAQTATGPEPRVLGEQVRADLSAVLEDLTRSSTTHRAMLVSLAAQHAESARLLGAPVDWPPLVGPEGTAAVPVLARTRPAVFGLEVVAARSRGEERAGYESVLGAARSTTRALTTLAGDAAPLPPLGYELPEPVDSEETRLALARALVRDIPPAVLSVVGRAGSDPEQLRSVVRLVAEAEHWRHQLGDDPAPFPGMTLP